MNSGKSLRIHIIGSDPRGLRSAELSNWSGQTFVGRRSDLAQVKKRKELHEPGVYLLISQSEESQVSRIYVGETDSFAERMTNHVRDKDKDWWEQFVVFVSKDRNLTKAHVRYLEKRLYTLAKLSPGTIALDNDKSPPGSSLPEADEASMQEFLENMAFVLEAMGLSYFPPIFTTSVSEDLKLVLHTTSSDVAQEVPLSSQKRFYITIPENVRAEHNGPLKAYMEIRGSLFVLKVGSYIRTDPRASFNDGNGTTRSSFLKWKRIVSSDLVEKTSWPSVVKLKNDVEFESSSAAGSVVRATATSGPAEWLRESDDVALKDCEPEKLEAA